jgi:hypothetical protein
LTHFRARDRGFYPGVSAADNDNIGTFHSANFAYFTSFIAGILARERLKPKNDEFKMGLD